MHGQPDSSPPDVYQALGFQKFDGQGASVEASKWRAMQTSDRLEDMRNRILIRRDKAGAPLVDETFVVGWVPPLNLNNDDVQKLLSTLTLAMSRGCLTVADWKQMRNR